MLRCPWIVLQSHLLELACKPVSPGPTPPQAHCSELPFWTTTCTAKQANQLMQLLWASWVWIWSFLHISPLTLSFKDHSGTVLTPPAVNRSPIDFSALHCGRVVNIDRTQYLGCILSGIYYILSNFSVNKLSHVKLT